jgi:methylthioribulose-1-phosphate dehydratase
MNNEFNTIGKQLVDIGRFMHVKGWVPATSGNFSARLSNGNIAITSSGVHKGKMTPRDIMLLNAEGMPLPISHINVNENKKPSAETLLHVQIYRQFQDARCVLHPHSVYATILSRMKKNEILLQDYELLKAFEGIDTHECSVKVPIFKNDQDIERLAGCVTEYFNTGTPVFGYLIEGHGFYTWGKSIDDCLKQVEAFEFLFQCEYMLRKI